jgi:hypothetical protein
MAMCRQRPGEHAHGLVEAKRRLENQPVLFLHASFGRPINRRDVRKERAVWRPMQLIAECGRNIAVIVA